MIDLCFPLISTQPIPADHGYLIYAAISRVLPALHRSNGVAMHPINGRQAGNRLLLLLPWSTLTLRTEPERIPDFLPLAGKRIELSRCTLRVGVPQVRALQPAPVLRSRLVTIKGFFEPEEFQAALRRQLDALSISSNTTIALGKRRTLKIKDKEIFGYPVMIEGLIAEQSLSVQETGLGGRRHMGCGVFVPMRLSKGATA